MTMWTSPHPKEADQKVNLSSRPVSRDPEECAQFGIPGQARNDTSIDILTFLSASRGKVMAYPARLVFTPFVVVVGGKYFLPVPECLIF
jgi:hypothetical protein